MSIFKVDELQHLSEFSGRKEKLAILERERPDKASAFFRQLEQTSFRIIGQVKRTDCAKSLRYKLSETISARFQKDPFYDVWVSDMLSLAKSFCNTLNSEAVGFCLTTERGCRRYHIDHVPLRLLVTYSGQGTEWLPDAAVDRKAFSLGAPNEKILKDETRRQFIKPWHVAIFKGGEKGLLHRTPDSALEGPSVLMRLDHANYWDKYLNQRPDKVRVLV